MLSGSKIAVATGAGLFLAGPAPAQAPGEITFFGQPNQCGQSFVVTGPRDNLRVPRQVRSVRLARDEAWDLCNGANHRLPCHRVVRNMANVNWRIASARPAWGANPMPPRGPLPPPGGGASLRGTGTEFFPAPAAGSGRVPSCASGAAARAAQGADRLCRSREWTAARSHRQETVRGTNFLADVLCPRMGG